ncbi:MAG: hypothetical protein ACI4GY_11130 [Acutalibacteraceae bacterium]
MSDNDIKIYNIENEETDENSTCKKMAEIYDLINKHRENGNLEKARQLGAKLATLTPTNSAGDMSLNLIEILPKKYLSQDILYQMKVLLVFAAEKTMKEEIVPDFLSIMAINAMHDKISENHPAFFKNLSDGAAFTFYRLALQKCGEIDENIGEAFAMLCSVQKNSEGFVETGRLVWTMAVDKIKKEIKKADFKK